MICIHSCPTEAMKDFHLETAEMDKKNKDEKLENCLPQLSSKTNVFCKNLYRVEKTVIAGDLLKDKECAEGIEVTLKWKTVSSTQTTEYFSDFKFDALDPGEYAIEIKGKRGRKANLENSVNLGMIVI